MNDINFTTYDVRAIVNYIKSVLKTKGYNYNISEKDIYDIPNDQIYAINKFKRRFGNNYIQNINGILKDYIIFKGGDINASQPYYNLERTPTTTKWERVQPHITNFLAGLSGSQIDKPTTASSLGVLTSAAASKLGNEIIIPGLAQKYNIQYQKKPETTNLIQPPLIPVETKEISIIQPIPKAQEKEIVNQMNFDLNILKKSCQSCDIAKANKEFTKLSGDKIIELGKMCSLCESAREAVKPKIITLEGGSNKKTKKPELIVENSLYTIDSWN